MGHSIIYRASLFEGKDRRKIYEVFSAIESNVRASLQQLCAEADLRVADYMFVDFSENGAVTESHRNKYAEVRKAK